jgi:hypothetical protein
MHKVNTIQPVNKLPNEGSVSVKNKGVITMAAIKYSQETTENTFFFFI